MYAIYCQSDGLFLCECRLQDGTERTTENTLEAAIEHCISFAAALNGTKITARNITILEPRQRVITEWVKVSPAPRPRRVHRSGYIRHL